MNSNLFLALSWFKLVSHPEQLKSAQNQSKTSQQASLGHHTRLADPYELVKDVI